MSLLPLFFLGLIVLLLAAVLIWVGYQNRDQVDPLAERLAEYGGTNEVNANLEDIEMSVPFSERVIMPIARGLASFTSRFTPQETLENTQRQLILAGSPAGLTPSLFWTMRFAATFGLPVLLVLVFVITNKNTLWVVAGGLLGAAVGFLLPQLWLSSKIKRRQDGVLKSLPDALDLMSICVNAGLGFDQAMSKVYEKWDNELAIAFGRVIQEIQLGKTRREALRAMEQSIDVQDVTSFVGAIIQADQLGVSISKVLNIQAEQMRVKRRQRAQEKAQQAPVKMVIPMVIFIFPSIWIVLLGPAGIQIFKTFFE